MSLGSCEFYVDEQHVNVSIPQSWGRVALPERARLVRAFMSERQLPAYFEPRLVEAIELLEPQPDPEFLFSGLAAEAAVGAWARLLDDESSRGQGAEGSEGAEGANEDDFDAAFHAILTAGASSEDGGPGWRQLSDMEESYASVLQELMVEHRNALEELQQLQHKEMTAQLGAEGNPERITTAARRRRAAATEALVHTHVTQLQELHAQQQEERREMQAAQRANYRSLAISISEEEEEAEVKKSSVVLPQTATNQTTAVESTGGTSWLAGKAMAMANSVAQIALYSATPGGEQKDSTASGRERKATSLSSSAATDHESVSSVNSDDLLTSGPPQLDFSGATAAGATAWMPRSHPGESAAELFSSRRRLLDSDDDQETSSHSHDDDCNDEVPPHQASRRLQQEADKARDESQGKGKEASLEELLDDKPRGSAHGVRLVVADHSIASMFRGAQTGTQRGGSDDCGDRGAESVHLSDPGAVASAPVEAEMPTSSVDHKQAERDTNGRSARQQRRLRHLQRMNAAPASLCVAIIFVDDAAGAGVVSLPEKCDVHMTAPAARRESTLHGADNHAQEDDDGDGSVGSASDFETGVAQFHSTGSGHLFAEACRTAGTDYHCPALEAQLSTLWTYTKHGAGSVDRFDGTGVGWPLQTGDHWCTTHGNLQDCSLTIPSSALGLTAAEPATASIAAAMGSLLTRKQKYKNSASKAAHNQNGLAQQWVEGDLDGILAPVWEDIVWNDGINGDRGSGTSSQSEKEASLIVAPHLVFQVLVRGADLHKRPIASIARICTAVRTIAAWCVRAQSVSDVLMPCSLPTAGAALATLHHSAAATPPFEVLDAFLDELKNTMEQQHGDGKNNYQKGLRRVVLLAGGGYPSQEKQAEHLAACKDAVGARATKLGWPVAE